MDEQKGDWVEVYPGVEGKVLRGENDLKHILRLWEGEQKTVGKLAVIDLAATVIALQAELAAERARRPAFLHDPEDTPHCYICGLCGTLEQLPDGRYRHGTEAECIGVVTGEIEAAWVPD